MRKAAVSDATPLIHLAKINKISLLQKLFDKIYISDEVYREVITRGRELNKIEIILIEDMVNLGFIEVKSIKSNLSIPTLHKGELDSMELCKTLKVKTMLIDEKEGYEAAKLLDLRPLRTTALLLKLNYKKILNKEEFKKTLLELSESGYFLSADTYNKILEAAKGK